MKEQGGKGGENAGYEEGVKGRRDRNDGSIGNRGMTRMRNYKGQTGGRAERLGGV